MKEFYPIRGALRDKLKKTSAAMRGIAFFLLVGTLHVSAAANAQQSARQMKFDLRMKQVSVSDVFKQIRNQSDFTFIYSVEEIGKLPKVTLDFREAEIGDILSFVLKETGLEYSINDQVVVIRKSVPSPQAQVKEISGTVSDEYGIPIPGVTVVMKGTTLGTATDKDGKFKLALPSGDRHVLLFSFIGFKSLEVEVTGNEPIRVRMEEDISEIGEVVVTGIFTKAKESYTGAVTHITSEELKRAGNTNLITQIRNIDPGFVITESNVWGSDPNRLPDIQLRGNTSLSVGSSALDDPANTFRDEKTALANSNQPLFIIDGFEGTLRQVMDMDPGMVESVTLLKDASATAMYGSRGANGIMVITTRKPESGRVNVTYKGDLAISAPDLSSYNLLNAREKLEYEVAAGLYEYDLPGHNVWAKELYSKRIADINRGVDTYWLKYPVRTGVGQRHSLRLDGGRDELLFALNLSYDHTAGVMKHSKRNTLTGSMFLQYNWKSLQLQNQLQITSNKASESPYGSFSYYARLNPYWTPYEEDGSLKVVLDNFAPPGYHGEITPANPLFDAKQPYRDDSSYDKIVNNFSVNWQIYPDLSVRGRFQINKESGRKDQYLSPKHSTFNQMTEEEYTLRGRYTYRTNNELGWEADLTANYSRIFLETHQVYAGLNVNFAESKSENNVTIAQGFAASQIYQLGNAQTYEKEGSPSSSDSHSRRVGLVANANYTYNGRYYADFSLKTEGSSIFGSDNRMATFWAAGMGWNAHRESFIEQIEAINNLRLRLSYGTSGSLNFNPFQSRTTFQFFKDQTYQFWSGAYMMALGNKDLKWQKTGQFNVGLELGLFKNAIRLNADFYNKLTDGVLMDINVPISSGFQNYKANFGEVRNRGYEISLSAFLIRDTGRDISWLVGGSLLHNKNKVMKISNAMEFLNEQLLSEEKYNPSILVKEGESLNTIYVVKSLGIDPSTGRELYLNREGEQTFLWDERDKTASGVGEPDLWGNFNTTVRYKGFSLNAVFAYTLGKDVYNQTLVNKVENVDPWYNVDERVYSDRWKEAGDHARFKDIRIYYDASPASSRFVMTEKSLECRSINLSYDFNPEWLRRNLGLAYLSVGAYTEDVFRISTIKQERGTSYPFSRKFSFSLTARF